MHSIIVYTKASNPNQFFVPVDKEEDLAIEVDKIKNKGFDATITIYIATQKSYVLTYRDETREVIDKIPEITLT